jgi:rubrerythrin
LDEITDELQAIKAAIQMEKDGYSFYKKAAAQTTSEMGKTIFESLANDERTHLDVFENIFEKRLHEKHFSDLVNTNKKYETVPIFPKDLKEKEGANPNVNELDALRIAMDSEKKAIDYYTKILQATRNPDIKKIIEMIIEQEKKHYLILEGEFSHISSTGYWYELDYLGG